ncbi:diacylglycerol kinase family protein [Bifidobacterium sp. ESL0790]|uniref:diacylglycerol/lipid kinase family protein n=1 Tax=Bifidobacterium sp. ESL0790 TaxID=2983233 RepID=UPI0023F6681D|nr:diacylglycerol kinase family protein [Bifidobacterium sp. ESL0790]WEV72060.1 diacylglycerol kinase family protein [Bifidobacterium sp. ESL0790]
MSGTVLIVIAAIICLIVVAVVALLAWRAYKRRKRVEKLNERDDDQVRYAFIVNPSKPQADKSRRHIEEFCHARGIKDIEFIETTLEHDGRACALDALDHGADVLVAVGGDGTVRTVASAISGTGHTLGIVPIGTGNLFARNMGIPIDDIDAALTVAISRGERMVDMGRMALLDRDDQTHAHAFLIIAGIGFDADMIEDTDPELKKNISWLAYFAGAMKHLFAPKYRGTITITSPDGTARTITNVHFRTMMAGNCGQIPMFSLMPDASFDDGLLDFEIIDTSGGILGWANLFGDVMHQTITGKAQQSPISTNSTMDQIQGTQAEVRLEKPALAEVDGDMLGESSHIRFSIEPKSLCVRVPSKEAIS